jgi:hypothetical protein
MINAKNEFLEHIKGTQNLTIKSAKVTIFFTIGTATVNLPVGYTAGDYLMFLESINKDYDNRDGSQNNLSLIWYTDEITWCSSDEFYDRHYKSCRTVPLDLP